MRNFHLIITCEHANNIVPYAYKYLFHDAESELISHTGWDPGALSVANYLAASNKVPIFYSEITRLLVEPNRSLDHPELFSAYTRSLKRSIKIYLLDRYYHPYRDQVEEKIGSMLKNGPVVHLSVHSFTPVLFSKIRSTDIGILFDPESPLEYSFCGNWLAALQQQLPTFQIDLNQPYSGIDDGFTTHLRKLFSDQNYVGIELELNQKWLPFIVNDLLIKALDKTLKKTVARLKKKEYLNNMV
jgi:predicted N-formylglutamate amidohydrolase